MKNQTQIILLFTCIITLLLSCKSSYTRIGDKNANYIPYYLKVYEADSLYLINDFEGSYTILDSLFKKYEPVNMDNYIEYGIYLNVCYKTNHKEKLKNKVINGFSKYGGIVTHHKESYEIYQEMMKSLNITNDQIKILKSKYYNSLDLQLRKQFIENHKKDQEVRNNGSTYEMIHKLDDENTMFLDSVFKKYEFPKKSIIGSNAAYDTPDDGIIYLSIFFRHQNEENRAKYLPLLYDAVKRGFLEPENYAVVYDRDLSLKNQNQKFGSYDCPGDCKLPKEIDSFRKNIGLPHIKYYPWKLIQFHNE
jgi:hypothetical protein